MDGEHDIQLQRWQLLKDLGLQEETFFLIADNTYDMESWILPDKTLAYISPSCLRITGYTREEHLQNPELLAEMVHPDDRKMFHALRKESFMSGSDINVCVRIITKSGETRWLDIVSQKVSDKEGHNLGLRTSSRDVTEGVQAKNELALSEARYKAVVESQSELIVRHTCDGIILFVNEAFARFTGVKAESMSGLRWYDLVDPEFVGKIRTMMGEITPEQPIRSVEMETIRVDGEIRYISWTSTGFFTEHKTLTELQIVGHDHTELKRSQDRLVAALAEVESLKRKLEEENMYLREKYIPLHLENEIVTDSPLMLEVMNKVKQVAATDAPVLLFGETGTGKELIANAIHNSSKRRNKLMITVNCAALPPSLIESELFGREKGAYTGALARQIGRFELANHSTIFLDEIGELPLEIQVKLLRVIQFGEFQMLGSPETKKVNVRIIAATNRDLPKAIADGVFRSDLFYRLNVFPISLPPLRDRKEDIPLLAWTFVDEIAAKMGRHIEKISTQSMNAMLRYSWPGNIRELRNLIEYSIIVAQNTTLMVHLPQDGDREISDDSLDEQQRLHIEKVLNQTGWRIRGEGGAAEILGIKESTLRFRMKKLGIERKK